MEKVKVISEKYNDKDVLEMDSADFKGAIENAIGQELSKIGSIDTKELIHKDFSVFSKVEDNELELSDVIDVLNKSFTDDYETVWYPLLTSDYNGWFAFLGNYFEYILYELDDFDEPTAFSDISCHAVEIKSIVPNPTLAGTESDLEGLQVDNTKYKVSKPIYCHPINVKLNSGISSGKYVRFDCLIFNNRATAYTSFREMITEMGNVVARILATGYMNGSFQAPNNLHIAYEIYYSSTNKVLSCNGVDVTTGNDNYLLISDTASWEDWTEEGFNDAVNRIN